MCVNRDSLAMDSAVCLNAVPLPVNHLVDAKSGRVVSQYTSFH